MMFELIDNILIIVIAFAILIALEDTIKEMFNLYKGDHNGK